MTFGRGLLLWLIGGVIAEVAGVVYDASIQGYLNRLQEEFAV